MSQSPARPFGLDIVGPVFQAGSDAAAATFQIDALPQIQSLISSSLGERQGISPDDVASIALDPTQLQLTTDADVRIYFVGEGAGYHNTLGVTTDASSGLAGDAGLVFPDASSYNSYFTSGDETMGYRSSSFPLLPGDFVDLGSLAAGTQLDFFLIANGASGGSDVFWATDSYNADGIQHMVALADPGSPYLVLGFEDLYGGGDRDFNDLMFVADIGAANVANLQRLVATPEPGTFVMLGSLSGIVAWSRGRNRRRGARWANG